MVNISPTPHSNPRIILPDGRSIKPRGCTSWISVLEYRGNLEKHSKRHVLAGVAADPDRYVPEIRAAWEDIRAGSDPRNGNEEQVKRGKRELDRIADRASQEAGGSDAANLGSYLHAACEAYDKGVPLHDVQEAVGPDLAGDIEAYARETAHFRHEFIEHRVYQPELNIAGTPDRLSTFRRGPGGLYVLDIKTGRSLEWGFGKMAMQLAIYAHANLYSEEGGRGVHRVSSANRDVGFIIWAPAGQGRCEIHEIDLRAGWEDVQEGVRAVYRHRDRKKRDVLRKVEPVRLTDDQIRAMIESCADAAQLRELYLEAAARGEWTEEHTALAKRQKEKF